MENENIIVLRLYSGEMIIGKEIIQEIAASSDASVCRLEDPRSIAIMPTMRGDLHIALKPICVPFAVERLKKNIVIPYEQVMFTIKQDEIDKELINGYKSEISGIKIASVADTMAINSGQQNNSGEFII